MGDINGLDYYYAVSQKKQSKLFFPQLWQMFTNFDNFWHEDGQDDEIMKRALIFYFS